MSSSFSSCFSRTPSCSLSWPPILDLKRLKALGIFAISAENQEDLMIKKQYKNEK
jgi:hypothetical protein